MWILKVRVGPSSLKNSHALKIYLDYVSKFVEERIIQDHLYVPFQLLQVDLNNIAHEIHTLLKFEEKKCFNIQSMYYAGKLWYHFNSEF